MRPVSVKFRCFGPYMDEQAVDFTRLERGGLFLICGETGAGKTTILDAMCIALYGRSSGGTRGELSDMRCKLAGRDDVTEVEFVFENGGRRYLFARNLRVARKNQIEEYRCMELREGNWIPVFENPKKTSLSAKAEEIIGLTYEQFRQVIILPQGQFERLLTSNSTEKEEILTSLFHTEHLERVTEELYRRVKERDDRLRAELAQMDAELKKYGCDSLELLGERALQDAKELERTHAQAEEAGEAARTRKALYEAALLENREFEDLAAREKTLAGLTAKKAEFEQTEEILRLADAAERLRPIHAAYLAAQTVRAEAEKKLKAANSTLTDANTALGAARKKRAAHEGARASYEALKAQAMRLENARAVYQSLAEKKAAVDARRALRRKAVAAKETADGTFREAETAWQNALEAQRQARRAYQFAQEAYLRGIGGILAQQLQAGRPCPVCGSTEHPAPAARPEEYVTDSELDKLAKAENSANDAEGQTRNARKKAETAKDEAASALSEIERELAGAQADYEHASAGRIEGIDTEKALDRALTACRDEISAFEKAETDTQTALQEAQSAQKLAEADAVRLTGDAEAARKDFEEKERAWQGALNSSPLADETQFLTACMDSEEKQRKSEDCARYRSDLRHAREAVEEKRALLQDKTAPDLDALKRSADAAEESANELKTRTALLEKELRTLENDRKALAERRQKYDAERRVVDGDLEFAGKLRGRTGVSLQRYVLGVKLSAITLAANRLLETVYGGRYRLYRTDDVAGRTLKAGLELEVYDTAQDERRSVTTLSGGEKFLVALSLAIGLSTVVLSGGGGVHMEAMFVDEGFGSLDNSAVDDAIGILQGIKRNAGMVVGIISHVERLEETIPTKLEVKKGPSGSTLRVHC